MARAPENIPTTATVTNNTALPIWLGNVVKIPASAIGYVIPFGGINGNETFAGDSQRVRAWSGLAALARVTGARPTAQVTITATVPALGTGAGELPVIGADDYDYPGAKRVVGVDVVTHAIQPVAV